jgi:hypothetical protein
MPHRPEPCQGFQVEVYLIAGWLPRVPLNGWMEFQVPQTIQARMAESQGDAEEGSLEQPRDGAEVEPLMAKIHGPLDPPLRLIPFSAASSRRMRSCSRCWAKSRGSRSASDALGLLCVGA